jgi:AbrB family looped-hinge helix DNA binding protein
MYVDLPALLVYGICSYHAGKIEGLPVMTTRISSKGQIVIPKEVREKLSFDEGVELEIRIQKHTLMLTKTQRKSWRRWRGAFKGTNMLRELEREHREEVARDAQGT